MQRVGAAVVAVLMVVVALLVRNSIDDDGDGGGAVRLLCTTELEAACTRLAEQNDGVDVTVEPAGTTAQSLVALPDEQRPSFDAWLAPSPWPQIVDVQRSESQKRPLFSKPSDPIGRSPLVLVARADRVPVLQATPVCDNTVDWKCIGAVAGRSWTELGGQAGWGTVKPAYGDPTVGAVPLLVLSQATSEFLGTVDYSLAELEGDEYLDWLSGIERAVPSTPTNPFLEMLQQLPTATYDVVGTTEAEAGPAIAAAAPDRRRELTLLYPEPVVTADVVLAAVVGHGDAADGLTGDIAGALAATGWRVPGFDSARGVRDTPALPRQSGLPDAGVLVALQRTWSGVPK